MNPLPLHPSRHSRTALQAVRSATAGLLLATLGCHAAMAQTAPSATPQTTSAAAATAQQPLTRAQVIAELECARESGELDAQWLRSYGMPDALPQHAPVPGCPGGHASASASAALPTAAPAH